MVSQRGYSGAQGDTKGVMGKHKWYKSGTQDGRFTHPLDYIHTNKNKKNKLSQRGIT